MINLTLFKHSIKSNYKMLLIFVAILVMYFAIIIGMYDPKGLEVIDALMAMKLPPELLSALGFTVLDSSLTGFIASFFYGMLMLVVPMVFYIAVANKIIAGYIDRGSMASILATPNKRIKIAITQAIFLIISIFTLITVITIFGIVYCQVKFPGSLDVGGFITMNFGVFLLHLAISGVCFFASCLFNESKMSLMLGAGVPMILFLIKLIANTGGELDNFKYATIFTLFDPTKILGGECALQLLALTLIGVVLYAAGIIVFNKKDIPV